MVVHPGVWRSQKPQPRLWASQQKPRALEDIETAARQGRVAKLWQGLELSVVTSSNCEPRSPTATNLEYTSSSNHGEPIVVTCCDPTYSRVATLSGKSEAYQRLMSMCHLFVGVPGLSGNRPDAYCACRA